MPRSDCAKVQGDLGFRCMHIPRGHIFVWHAFSEHFSLEVEIVVISCLLCSYVCMFSELVDRLFGSVKIY